MKIAFANSAAMPTMERLILRGGSMKKVPLRVRYGIIFHPKFGPTLIDTGYSQETVSGNRSLPLRIYGMTFRPRLKPDGQIEQTLENFDLTPDDIRYVIVTHFHADHISGLRQLRNAQFIVDRAAAQRVLSGRNFANQRHGIFKELLPNDFAERLIDMCDQPVYSESPMLPDGFDVFGDQSVITVSLPGHTHSHFGVYFPTLTRPLLYATDVQWLRTALMHDRLPGFPASVATADMAKARKSATYVRDFAQSGGDVVLCHDPEKTAWDI